jgi:hypothetical protein
MAAGSWFIACGVAAGVGLAGFLFQAVLGRTSFAATFDKNMPLHLVSVISREGCAVDLTFKASFLEKLLSQ